MSERPTPSSSPAAGRIAVKRLGLADYEHTWRAMQTFTDERDAETGDELWILQHPPVFTLGLAGKREHLLAPGEIPVIPVDRGGQVTYHGPGQLVAYPLLDIRRRRLGVRALVTALETAVVELLKEYGVDGYPRPDAPGVYVDGRKIASVGLRIRRGASYHGVSLNVDMDLEPFSRINPCGYAGLEVTQLKDLAGPVDLEETEAKLERHILEAIRGS